MPKTKSRKLRVRQIRTIRGPGGIMAQLHMYRDELGRPVGHIVQGERSAVLHEILADDDPMLCDVGDDTYHPLTPAQVKWLRTLEGRHFAKPAVRAEIDYNAAGVVAGLIGGWSVALFAVDGTKHGEMIFDHGPIVEWCESAGVPRKAMKYTKRASQQAYRDYFARYGRR